MSSLETRMAAFDAVMYGVEQDPVLRSTIVVMFVLEGEPDLETGIARVERMTRVVPKLRQIVAGNPVSLLPPRWDPDPNFDLDYHLRRYHVQPDDGSLRPAIEIAEQMAEHDFDRDRPLWEMALVTGLADNRSAVIFKIHHAITDGVGGMAMAASIFDLTGDLVMPVGPDPDIPEPREVGSVHRVTESLQAGAEASAESFRFYSQHLRTVLGKLTRDPAGTAVEGADFVASAARVLAPATESMSPIMQGRTLSLRFDLLEAPLADLKAAGKSVGGTLNDAFMAVVSGGLQRYHEVHGSHIADVRVNMPVNLRGSGEAEAGNRWVPARFLIPIDISDPRERMRVLSPLLHAARSEPALPISDFVMRRLVKMPQGMMTAIAGGMMKGTDVAATNVPGPPIPVYMAGAKVLQFVPFAPKGGAALNVALMSYNGSIFLGLNIDTGAIRDPDTLVRCLREALDEVLAVGREPSPAPRAQEPAAKKPVKKAAAKKPAAKKPVNKAAAKKPAAKTSEAGTA